MRPLSLLVVGLCLASLAAGLWLYPRLPAEMVNHIDPSVPSGMPKAGWLALNGGTALLLVAAYFALPRTQGPLTVLHRLGRLEYDLLFLLTAALLLTLLLLTAAPSGRSADYALAVFAVLLALHSALVASRPWLASLLGDPEDGRPGPVEHKARRASWPFLAVAALAAVTSIARPLLAAVLAALGWAAAWLWLGHLHRPGGRTDASG